MDPVGAVRAPGRLPDLMDVGPQSKVDHVPITGLLGLLDPLVVGRLADLQDPCRSATAKRSRCSSTNVMTVAGSGRAPPRNTRSRPSRFRWPGAAQRSPSPTGGSP